MEIMSSGIMLDPIFHLTPEAGPLRQTQSRLPDFSSLARQLALGILSLSSQAGFKAGQHAHMTEFN